MEKRETVCRELSKSSTFSKFSVNQVFKAMNKSGAFKCILLTCRQFSFLIFFLEEQDFSKGEL